MNHPYRRRDDYIVDIYKSAVRLLTPAILTDSYKIIVDEAIRLVKAQYGSIFIFDGTKLSRSYSTVPANRQSDSIAGDNIFKALRSQKPIIVSVDRGQKIFIPLVSNGCVLGVLSAKSLEENVFDQRRVEALTLFGSISALALSRAQLFDQLQESVKTRDLFISMASHELKTPVTAIKGYSSLIYSKVAAGEKLPLVWCQQLMNDVDRMTGLVNELLQVNQIKTGKLHYNFKGFNLREVIYQIVFDLKQTRPDYQIVVRDRCKDINDKIVGDKDKITQVVINLLNNAINHSPFGAKVYVIIDKCDDKLQIEVADKGSGIPEKDRKRIFDEYYRVEGEKKEGFGLGLFLTKNIIEAHHGEIKVQSKVGKGTRMIVTLPRKQT